MTSLTISEIRVEQDAFNPEIIRAAIRAGSLPWRQIGKLASTP